MQLSQLPGLWSSIHGRGGSTRTQHVRSRDHGHLRYGVCGAFYLLWEKYEEHGRIFVRIGVIGGNA